MRTLLLYLLGGLVAALRKRERKVHVCARVSHVGIAEVALAETVAEIPAELLFGIAETIWALRSRGFGE